MRLEVKSKMNCTNCRYFKGNGGIDCDPDPEDYFLDCDAFEELEIEAELEAINRIMCQMGWDET